MKSNCPPKLVLEGFFLTGRTTDEIRSHASSCTRCRDLLGEWDRERASFLKTYPFKRLLEEIKTHKREKSFWGKFLLPAPLRVGLAFAAISCLMVFVLWHQNRPQEITPKGGIGLGFFVLEKGQIHEGEDRMSLPGGSQIQFVYSSHEMRQLLIVGIEENGSLMVYFPSDVSGSVSKSAVIEAGDKRPLPQAIRWEPTSSYERFYALVSDNPILQTEVNGVVQKMLQEGKKVESIRRLPLPYTQASMILYRKGGK